MAAVAANPQAAANSLTRRHAVGFGFDERLRLHDAIDERLVARWILLLDPREAPHALVVLKPAVTPFADRQFAHMIARFFRRGSAVAGEQRHREKCTKNDSHAAMLSNVADS